LTQQSFLFFWSTTPIPTGIHDLNPGRARNSFWSNDRFFDGVRRGAMPQLKIPNVLSKALHRQNSLQLHWHVTTQSAQPNQTKRQTQACVLSIPIPHCLAPSATDGQTVTYFLLARKLYFYFLESNILTYR